MEGYLDEAVAAVPLVDSWYAWGQLVDPVSYALNIRGRYIPLLESFVEAPELHADAVQDDVLLGGPFVGLPASDVDRAAGLLSELRCKAQLASFAAAIRELYAGLGEQRDVGTAAEIAIPKLLQGLVDVGLDVLGRPHVRIRGSLVEEAGLVSEARQSVYLSRLHPDRRTFVFSTPFLDRSNGVEVATRFADSRLDALFRAYEQPVDAARLGADLGLSGAAMMRFSSLFLRAESKRRYRPPDNKTLRWRHFGHGCVLVEAEGASILIDPLIAHASPKDGPERPTYGDLPPRIDALVLTHNHQDHVTVETLLRLRHRVERVIAPNALDTLEDPSVASLLRRLGYDNIHILEEFGETHCGAITVEGYPFSGEHGDLDVRSRLNYKVSCAGRSLFFASDSDVRDTRLYQLSQRRIGRLDALFLGMECEGAPVSWVYGPLFPKPLPWRQDQARRLSGADYEGAKALVDILRPEAAYVYAMGEEPWVTHLSSKAYTPQAFPMRQAAQFVEYCQARGMASARLVGCPSYTLML